jgi:hypothetical protein
LFLVTPEAILVPMPLYLTTRPSLRSSSKALLEVIRLILKLFESEFSEGKIKLQLSIFSIIKRYK